jgi:hypothetical protein
MHQSRAREAMSTSTQRRSNLDPLYRRSRSAWTCLLIAFPKLPLTLPFLALGGGRGASLGCSTLASLPQAIGVLLSDIKRLWTERPRVHEFSTEFHYPKCERVINVYAS